MSRAPTTLDAAVADLRARGGAAHVEALASACAIVAYADGWVTGAERRAMLLKLQGFALGAGLDMAATMDAFEKVTGAFDRDPDLAESEGLGRLRAVAGRDAAYLVEIACAIADADGGFDAAEREAAARISRALGLKPARFGLAEAR
ncbi:TerB family tellurite resistance protein [Phenylobacterium sp.]|uniref:TerB family tellurite resistance protein n=1 Tax=Phenylobacterium sp. TaxID=1871053 RepID=UPI003BAA2BD8